jgi:hypothetical protein
MGQVRLITSFKICRELNFPWKGGAERHFLQGTVAGDFILLFFFLIFITKSVLFEQG